MTRYSKHAPGKTSGNPARTSEHVAKIAGELRRTDPPLDDMSVARMERAVVQEWRVRAARIEPLQEKSPGSRPRNATRGLRTWALAMVMAGSAAFGAVLAFQMFEVPVSRNTSASAAQFEMRFATGATQRGSLSEGQTLESGRHGHIQVDVGRSRVELDSKSRVRFDRLSPDAVRLTVVEGRIEATFNPEHSTGRTMAIETRAARVQVIGTRFSVAVDAQGDTEVIVHEGIVDVLPRNGMRQRLTAGESTQVLLDQGDATERAVREAIAAELAATELPPPSDLSNGPGAVARLADDHAEDDTSKRTIPPAPAAGPVKTKRTNKELVEARLEQARLLLHEGKHTKARRKLHLVAQGRLGRPSNRAEAWTLIAESFTAQGQVLKAANAYARAAKVGANTTAGHNALFAMARLLERFRQDANGARASYDRYLRVAPNGALAGQAHRALCRLGESAHCTDK